MVCCQALPVCYQPGNPVICGGAVQSPTPLRMLTNPELVQNTAPYPIIGTVANTVDGVLNVPISGAGGLVVGGSSGYSVMPGWADTIHISYDLPTPSRVYGFAYWNGYGSDHADGDGVGGILLNLYDVNGALLALNVPIGNVNNGARHDTIFGAPVNDVSNLLVRLGSKPFAGSSGAALREVALILGYESEIAWSCGGLFVTGHVQDGGNPAITQTIVPGSGISLVRGGSVTVAGGNITQVNGPHNITFNAGGNDFVGNIVTDKPVNFSSLVIDQDNPTITLTGNTVQTFSINWNVTVDNANARKGRLTDGVLYDLGTGLPVTGNFTIVSCG